MNNEEKILSTLETLVDKVGNLEQGQARLEHEVVGIKSDVGSLKSEMGSLKSEVAEIKSDLKVLTSKVDDISTKLDAVAALQVDDYTSLSALEKKVNKLVNTTTIHEQRFIKMKEAI